MSNENSIVNLASEVLTLMEKENHSRVTIAGYSRIYDKFGVFCRDNQANHFTDESGQAFLEAIKLKHPEYSRSRVLLCERAIRRLKCVVDGVAWKPMYHPKQELPSSCFDMILQQYSDYLSQTSCSPKYSHSQLRDVSKFLCRLEKYGVNRLEQLTAECIYEIFSDWEYCIRTRRDICAFLKYAYVYKIISANLATIVPTMKRHYAIPSVYTPEEVEKVLASVDRSIATGKRNYAILLLAARLGIRASDIAALTFDNLKSEEIVFVQAKTKHKHSLLFLTEVKVAIDDYVSNSRPKSSYQKIFLDKGGYSPISAGNVGDIVRNTFARSGVNCKKRRSGSHALRASLATALLAEGNSYFTVQKLLGHTDVQTSKSYAKADAEQLRICALPVPAPTGNFKAYLSRGT
jgi:site-specific recombinase XerD